MNRRFLNLVVEESCGDMYSLRRINLLKHLFYPSTVAAQAAAEAKTKKQNATRKLGGWLPLPMTMESLKRLPKPEINFQAPPLGVLHGRSVPFFAQLGSESRILCSDSLGQNALYDVDTHSVVTMPCLHAPKGPTPISFSITQPDAERRDSLYVMDPAPYPDDTAPTFEVLVYDITDIYHEPVSADRCSSEFYMPAWRWHPLPPPPLFDDPGFGPADMSYTVVGGSICLSSAAEGIGGTYAFDTASCVWRQASKWALPFVGKAEYIPEFNLWFGFSACSPYRLCALDLSAAMDSEQPPPLQHTWDDVDLPQECPPFQFYLLNLGSGRFCITKIFGTGVSGYSSDDGIDEKFAVFTGVELVRCDDGLRMIKHKSKLYMFDGLTIDHVL